MEPRPAPPERATGQTRRRVLSALVLAPPAVLAVHFGPPASDALVAVAGGGMAWEWARLAGGDRLGTLGWTQIALVLLTVLLAAASAFGWALAALMGGALAIAAVGLLRGESVTRVRAIGLVYIGLACLSFQWVSHEAKDGSLLLFWLFAVVWTSDTGAYFAGRSLGGPKLAPRISPAKTWSGLLGGLLAGMLVGALFAELSGLDSWLAYLVPSFLLSLVSQLGDLLESFIKRRFGVKDTSGLIPGHGGILDRVDSVLAACLFTASFSFITEAAI